jgi:hypothetical protein
MIAEPPAELAPVIELVRRQAVDLDALEVAITWRTSTGEMRIDYRASDFLTVTFSGDDPERRWCLPPDWGVSC